VPEGWVEEGGPRGGVAGGGSEAERESWGMIARKARRRRQRNCRPRALEEWVCCCAVLRLVPTCPARLPGLDRCPWGGRDSPSCPIFSWIPSRNRLSPRYILY
jgi:hypothetical protein